MKKKNEARHEARGQVEESFCGVIVYRMTRLVSEHMYSGGTNDLPRLLVPLSAAPRPAIAVLAWSPSCWCCVL
jgi:hypothetical protein